eukprot:COSAG02_NODE_19876_length_860_cov_1.671485_2_plen_47_part_01
MLRRSEALYTSSISCAIERLKKAESERLVCGVAQVEGRAGLESREAQ